MGRGVLPEPVRSGTLAELPAGLWAQPLLPLPLDALVVCAGAHGHWSELPNALAAAPLIGTGLLLSGPPVRAEGIRSTISTSCAISAASATYCYCCYYQ